MDEQQVATAEALGLDAGDPAVAVLTWALTEAARRLLTRAQAQRARHVLPVVAVLVAVAARAGWEAVQGAPLTLDVVLRGLGAAGIAALGHSQIREVEKARAETRTRKRDDT
jgi:hypothetical protein